MDNDNNGSGSAMTRETRDYSGVPTAEIVKLYEEHVDVDTRSFAERIGIDERILSGFIVGQRYSFIGWTMAERILEGLDLNSSFLLSSGELHEVPARDSRSAALKIIDDVYWALDMPAPTGADLEEEVERLLELRRTLCAPSPEQQERLRRDAERYARRLERQKDQSQAAA